jgi:rod shape-determining protein MreC
MALLDLRLRTGWLFMAVAIGHIILISAQVNTQRGVPLLEAITFGVFSEVQRASAAVIGGVKASWENYFALQRIRRENERLREEVAQLRIGLQQERALAQQSRMLEDLLELRKQLPMAATAASVIAAGASPEFRTMTIDKGTLDGLGPDMAVIAPDGVVGRIVMPSARASKVQLLIDRNAAAGAIVERSRAQGLVVGTGTDRLRLEYVQGTADIEVGDRVVTSGIEGIYPTSLLDGAYPKGFVIGQIESIQRAGGAYSSIIVKPAVDFSTLEAVLVVTAGSRFPVSESLLVPDADSRAPESGPRLEIDRAVVAPERIRARERAAAAGGSRDRAWLGRRDILPLETG